MIKFQTEHHGTFEAASKWEDLTIRQFEEISKIQIPEKLLNTWMAAPDDKAKWESAYKAITTREHMKEHPDYFRKIMEVLTTMPKEKIDITEWKVITDFYYDHLHQFVISIFYKLPMVKTKKSMEPFNPKEIDQFEYKETVYKLPTSIRLMGDEKPMANEPIVTFAEATDVEIAFNELNEFGVEKLSYIISIYARANGEKYNSEVAIKQAEEFRNLDMATAWAVFFCIQRRLKKYILNSLRFLNQPEETMKSSKSRIQDLRVLITEA